MSLNYSFEPVVHTGPDHLGAGLAPCSGVVKWIVIAFVQLECALRAAAARRREAAGD